MLFIFSMGWNGLDQSKKEEEEEKKNGGIGEKNLDGGFVRRLVLLGKDLLEIDRGKERMGLDRCNSFWGHAPESLLGVFDEELFFFFFFSVLVVEKKRS